MLDVPTALAIDARCPRAAISLDAVPGHRKGGRVTHEVEEVIEPLVRIRGCPLVQLRLDVEYPGPRLDEVGTQSVAIQRGIFSRL